MMPKIEQRKCSLFLLLGLVVSLVIVACTSTHESSTSAQLSDETESYIQESNDILDRVTEIALEAAALYKIRDKLSKDKINQTFADYDREYDQLLNRFARLECPPECEKMQEHALSGISYFQQEVKELGVAYATGGSLDKAKEYYNKGQSEFLKVAQEMDKLRYP